MGEITDAKTIPEMVYIHDQYVKMQTSNKTPKTPSKPDPPAPEVKRIVTITTTRKVIIAKVDILSKHSYGFEFLMENLLRNGICINTDYGVEIYPSSAVLVITVSKDVADIDSIDLNLEDLIIGDEAGTKSPWNNI
jgi:hypothetical protein